MKNRVLVVGEHFVPGNEVIEHLRQNGAEVIALPRFDVKAEELAATVAEVQPDGMVVGIQPVTAAVLAAAPSLRVVARYGVGYERVDVAAATRLGICVTYEPNSNSVSVAELTFGLIIAAARGIIPGHSLIQAGGWKRVAGIELAGKTLGIIGLGRIGKQVARRALGFDMRVIANDIVEDPEFAGRWGIPYVSLDTVLAEADVLSLHVPVTPLTHGMINRAAIRKMKAGAVLINAARGEVVENDAVAEAIREGHLLAAGLDAFSPEPPVGSPVIGLPNVVTTPHLGAYTHEALRRMLFGAADSALAVLSNHRPAAPVNPEVLDRL